MCARSEPAEEKDDVEVPIFPNNIDGEGNSDGGGNISDGCDQGDSRTTYVKSRFYTLNLIYCLIFLAVITVKKSLPRQGTAHLLLFSSWKSPALPDKAQPTTSFTRQCETY